MESSQQQPRGQSDSQRKGLGNSKTELDDDEGDNVKDSRTLEEPGATEHILLLHTAGIGKAHVFCVQWSTL